MLSISEYLEESARSEKVGSYRNVLLPAVGEVEDFFWLCSVKQNLGDFAPRLLLAARLEWNHLAYLASEENHCPILHGCWSSFRTALSHAVSF